MMITARCGPVALMLAAGLASCTERGREGAQYFTVRDSAGIQIIESERPAWEDGRQWRLSEQPVLAIGVRDGAEEYQLYRVYGSVRLSDGRIVVANAGTNELRFFDSSGDFLNSAGRSGEGPGEFEALRQLFLIASDSLLVWDSRNRRVSIFDTEGAYQRSYSFAPFLNAPVFVNVVVPLSDATVLAGAFAYRSAQSAVEFGLSRDTIVLLHCDQQGELIDTVGAYPGTEWYTTSEYPRVDVPFARESYIVAHGDGFYFGDNAKYEISYRRTDGLVERIIRKEHGLIDVTPEAVEEQKQQWLAGISPERRQRVALMFEEVVGPPMMPAFSDLRVDAAGNLWVREYQLPGDSEPGWTVFSSDGSMLGTVVTPYRFTVHEIGHDYVLGRWRDEEDVEYVQLYELHKP
jgi:hypothetical protein